MIFEDPWKMEIQSMSLVLGILIFMCSSDIQLETASDHSVQIFPKLQSLFNIVTQPLNQVFHRWVGRLTDRQIDK